MGRRQGIERALVETELSSALRHALGACLEPNPGRRIASARQLASLLAAEASHQARSALASMALAAKGERISVPVFIPNPLDEGDCDPALTTRDGSARSDRTRAASPRWLASRASDAVPALSLDRAGVLLDMETLAVDHSAPCMAEDSQDSTAAPTFRRRPASPTATSNLVQASPQTGATSRTRSLAGGFIVLGVASAVAVGTWATRPDAPLERLKREARPLAAAPREVPSVPFALVGGAAEATTPVGPPPAVQPAEPSEPAAAKEPPPVAVKRAHRKRDSPQVNVTVGLIPSGEVTIDGRAFGRAPVQTALKVGKHRVVGRLGERRVDKTIQISPDSDLIIIDLRDGHDHEP